MNKPYRDCVVAVIRDAKGQLLVGERADHAGAWQLPQGGIDEGESAEEALFRELREEIGTDRLKVLKKLPNFIRYDFPSDMKSGPAMKYRGQQQAWFLLELLPDGVPNLELSDGEFQGLKWTTVSELLSGVVPWKRAAYGEGLRGFGLVS